MPASSQRIALCLMGPTATGKTDIALALAGRLPLGLISVDSAMVYRGLDIGTGKPSAGELARHPHHLIDIREPWERYSAGEFVADATTATRDIQSRGQVPLLVGGTMLYFRSLIDGLSPLPSADPALRAQLEARAAVAGWPAMHRELESLDPVAAARIGISDRQRIQRALEVCLLTGGPMSAIQSRPTTKAEAPPITYLKIGILPSVRSHLSDRIAQRFGAMLERGLVAEVERLLALPAMHPDQPALRAVGYRQLAGFIQGKYSRADAEARALTATRQLAKRQMTWLRQERCDLWLEMESTSLVDDLAEVVTNRVLQMQNHG